MQETLFQVSIPTRQNMVLLTMNALVFRMLYPENFTGFPNLLLSDGSDFKGERLTVQFARGPRHKENFNGPTDRTAAPRPRRTIYRMQLTGLPTDTSWQVSRFSFLWSLVLLFDRRARARIFPLSAWALSTVSPSTLPPVVSGIARLTAIITELLHFSSLSNTAYIFRNPPSLVLALSCRTVDLSEHSLVYLIDVEVLHRSRCGQR